MEGFWPIFFLMVVLKIPVAALLYLVWWAIRAEPQVAEEPDGDGHGFRRFGPRRPGGPRRGPHAPDALPLPECPPGGRRRAPAPAVAGRPLGAGESARRGSPPAHFGSAEPSSGGRPRPMANRSVPRRIRERRVSPVGAG